ncbi:MAG: MerR family transcriptional regulator [Labilithrix sp.]|nr:MerR family transcriptional regulator [Labilithrix sp.]
MTSESTTRGELTIDEIAAESRVPSRTIRFYQSRGALMAPTIRGRVAYYGPQHLERLELIAQLQDRGLSIDAIRDLLTSIDKGETDLAEWLGIEQQLQTSWANDHPRTVTEAELYELAGVKRPGLIADLLRLRLLERRGEVLLLLSPALLNVAMKLEAAGIDLDTGLKGAEVVKKHMARTAADLVELFVRRASEGAIEVTDVAAMFQALRPTGLEAVRVIFGREMERALRKLLESGKMASLQARAKKKKR